MRLQLLLVFLGMMMFEGFLSVATAQEQSQNDRLLQGTWHLVQLEQEGNKLVLIGEIVYVFDANTVQIAGNAGAIEKATYKLGYSNGQNTLDLINKDGISLGIYKVDKERLVICSNAFKQDQSRPTEFATKPKSRSILAILEKSPASPPSEVIAGIPAVVVEKYTGTTLKENQEFTFLPGEQVKVKSTSPKSVLVESTSIIGAAWVPRKILISQVSFKLVEKWAGEKHHELIAGDYVADYSFDSSCGFKRKTFDENGRPFVVSGHLYRYKNILWARDNNEYLMQNSSLFIVMSGGKLCWLTNEECSAP